MSGSAMRRFWDRRADEDPFFFVDSRQEYGRPDAEAFWARGEEDLGTLLGALGASFEPSDRVVEIGCGIGRLTRAIAGRVASVVALDVSERMLELGRERNAGLTNVEWVLGDGSSLAGIESASADACIAHVVFQHIPDPAVTLGYIREMGRVLRPGGWAAFEISNEPERHRMDVATRARVAVRGLLGRGPRGQADQRWRGSHLEIGAVRDAAADGGMAVERVVGEGTLLCGILARRTG